jgi:hypothetical protein
MDGEIDYDLLKGNDPEKAFQQMLTMKNSDARYIFPGQEDVEVCLSSMLLCLAVEHDDQGIEEFLLTQHKADPRLADLSGNSAICCALEMKKFSTVARLSSCRRELIQLPLQSRIISAVGDALESGDCDPIHMLETLGHLYSDVKPKFAFLIDRLYPSRLEQVAEVSCQDYALFKSSSRKALDYQNIVAAVKTKCSKFEFLEEDIEKYVASMLLLHAVSEENREMIALLLTHYNADPRIQSASGISALSSALGKQNGSFKIILQLCSFGGTAQSISEEYNIIGSLFFAMNNEDYDQEYLLNALRRLFTDIEIYVGQS